MSDTPQQFTAARIAEVLGKSPRVVRRWLSVALPDSEMMVRGNLASVWRFESLPVFIQQELKSSAQCRGFADARELMSGGAKAWETEIPWNEICPEQQSQAIKLQRALLPALEHWREITRSPSARGYVWREDTTLLSLGVRVYETEFGAKVSEKHWHYLFNRVLERDRGAAQFHRPELFLSGNPRCAASTVSAADTQEFPALHDLIFNKFSDPRNPSTAERARLWQCAFQTLLPFSGRELKVKRLRLLKYLWAAVPWLAASKNALRMALDRFVARGNECGGAIEAFADGREERRGIPTAQPYDEGQIAAIKITAVNFTGGRRAEAARELNAAGLITDPRIKRSLDTATSKSYLPASLRAKLKDVPAWQVVQLGDKSARKLVPPMKLSYDGIASMCCLVPDDHTPDLYVAVPDGGDWFNVMRPQLILISDFRSNMIVGRGIVPAPQFTAVDVVAPFRRVFAKFGLPRFILREGGKIFRGSNLVNSMADTGASGRATKNDGREERNPFSVAEIEYGLERANVVFSDAEQIASRLGEAGIGFRESYQARSKPVEGVIRLFTSTVQRLPCYCGNDERLNCPESTKRAVQDVRDRKKTPQEAGMLTWTQWIGVVDEIVKKYNSTKQEGRRLRNPLTGAPMSPEEAFEVFTNTGDPPHGFDAQCAMYMAAMRIPVQVKKPNIRRRNFLCGFVEVMGNTYCDEQTGARIGQNLLAFYDPETPEACTFTDINMRNPFTVSRLESVNALFPDEQTKISRSQAHRAVSGLRADYRAAETKFVPAVREAIVAPLIKTLNQQIEKGTAAAQEKKRRKTDRAATISKRARGVGIRPGLVENSERSQSALELIAEAKRAREREKQQEKTT